MSSTHTLRDAWDVLLIYLIPFGGGIPAGVLLARARGFDWPVMAGLYFVSDVILAFAFEPLTWCVKTAGRRFLAIEKFLKALKQSMDRIIQKYGIHPSPFTLILISFGVDPMTGRTAALAAGHGFISGWAIAIVGDMFYFALIMISTLWLSSLLGDGTWTTVCILIGMTVIPTVLRRLRQLLSSSF